MAGVKARREQPVRKSPSGTTAVPHVARLLPQSPMFLPDNIQLAQGPSWLDRRLMDPLARSSAATDVVQALGVDALELVVPVARTEEINVSLFCLPIRRSER